MQIEDKGNSPGRTGLGEYEVEGEIKARKNQRGRRGANLGGTGLNVPKARVDPGTALEVEGEMPLVQADRAPLHGARPW